MQGQGKVRSSCFSLDLRQVKRAEAPWKSVVHEPDRRRCVPAAALEPTYTCDCACACAPVCLRACVWHDGLLFDDA